MASILDTAAALWDPAKKRIYTFMVPDDEGNEVSAWGGQTLAEMIADGSVSADSIVMPQDDALALHIAAEREQFCTGPQSISAERFDELLNALPPARWFRGEASESFMVPEAIVGNIYTFCVRCRDRYFTINEYDLIPHNQLVWLCLEHNRAAES